MQQISQKIPDGVFAVWKPIGKTSADIVASVKKEIIKSLLDKKLARSVKVGHGGTLDPMAEGILVIGVGKSCKQLADFLKCKKEYVAGAIFGKSYDTLDTTGKVIAQDPEPVEFTADDLQKSCSKWVGEVAQLPPDFSAIRINGKRAYELAREGIAPALKSRNVTVDSIEIVDFCFPTANFRMKVGGGTYVRSLIRDIAADLKTYGAMSALVRTKQGPFMAESMQAPGTGVLSMDSIKEIDLIDEAMVFYKGIKEL